MISSVLGLLVGIFNIRWSLFHLRQKFDILHYVQYLLGVFCIFMNFVVIVGHTLEALGLIPM